MYRKNRIISYLVIFFICFSFASDFSVFGTEAHEKTNGLEMFHDGNSLYGENGVIESLNLVSVMNNKCLEFSINGNNEEYMLAKIHPAVITKTDKKILSYDVMAGQTNQLQFTQITGRNADNEQTTIGEFLFSKDGKMGYRATPSFYGGLQTSFPGGTSSAVGYTLAEYEANKWYHIDILFDYTTGMVSYYVDGSPLGSGHTFSTDYDYEMFFITAKGGDDYNAETSDNRGSEKFWFDNYTVYNAGADGLEADLAGVDSKNREIKLIFSEPLSSNLSDTKIYNTETEKEVDFSVTTSENTAVFKYAGELEGLTEYLIRLPEGVKGKLNGKLIKREIRIQTGVSTSPDNLVYTTSLTNNFDDGTSNLNWASKYQLPVGEAGIYFVEEEGRGKVLKTRYNTQKPAATATDIMLGCDDIQSPNAYTMNEYLGGNVDIITFDFKTSVIPLNLSFSPAVSNGALPYSFFISENGWMTASETAPSQSTAFFDKTKEDLKKDGYNTFDYQKDKWYTLKIVINKLSSDNSVSFYVDDTLLGEKTGISATSLEGINNLLIKNVSATVFKGDVSLYIDNLTIKNGAVVSVPKAKSASLTTHNGVYGALDTVDRDINKINVEFYDEMDLATLNADTVSLWYNNTKAELKKICLSNNTLTIVPTVLPGCNDRIKLTINGAKSLSDDTMQEYNTYFYVSDAKDGDLHVGEFVYSDESGGKATEKSGTLYADGAICNTSDTKKSLMISLTGYNGNKMTFIKIFKAVIEPGQTAVVSSDKGADCCLAVENAGIYDSIQIAVDSIGESGKPIINPVDFN